jgi:hypothetical protein
MCPMKGFLRAAALTCLVLVVTLVPAATASATTIDFSTHGQGLFDQSFFEPDGLVFTEGSFVGYIQGDEALVGPVAGAFKPKTLSLSARVAPATQGTAVYTLTALSSSGAVVESASVTVSQDEGDPAHGGWGYFTIDLGTLPAKARSFTLTNAFVRSSFPHITTIPFGVASVSF